MFDPFTLALIGGAAGGLLNKKDPLKGALLGAGAGYTGGALAGGGGFLGAAPAAATPGAAGAAGASSMATSLPAFNPITGTYANATQLPGMTGAMESLKSFNAAVKPVGEAAGAAMQVRGMFQDNTPAPVAQSSLPQRVPMDVSGLLGSGQVAELNQKRMARRGLLG